MTPAHLHVILNHIPVIGVPIGAALLVYAFIRRSEEVKRASLLVFIIIALITVPTFLAGKAAEQEVEHLPGVSEEIIERHEEAATIGLIGTSLLGVLALGAFGWSLLSGRLATPVTALVLLVSLGVAGWLGRVANLGGQVRHTEFRDGAAVAEAEDDRDEPREREDGERRRGRHRRGRDH
jgi:hypothetical protein